MTFEQFIKNVGKITRLSILSISTTEWIIFHPACLKESIEKNGNLFQPYRTIMEIRVPLFILVCEDASESPRAAEFKKKGFPVMDAATLRLPPKKETETFINAFLKAHLHQTPFN